MMDSTAGDLNSTARDIGANIEKQLSQDLLDEKVSGRDTVGEKQELEQELEQEQKPPSSGSSSDGTEHLKEIDSHIIKVQEVKDGDEAYAHLPPHEKEIVKRQLHMPEITVTFKTLYRYATRIDLIIIAISSLCAITGGAVMPLMTVSTLSSNQKYRQLAH